MLFTVPPGHSDSVVSVLQWRPELIQVNIMHSTLVGSIPFVASFLSLQLKDIKFVYVTLTYVSYLVY